MIKHTKEPWFHHAASGSQHCAGGYINASESRSDHAIAHICGSGFKCGEYQANARRIVACVNACAGLPTEQLESSPIGGVLNGVAGLIAHRDDLLAALEGLLADMRLRAKLDGDVDSDGCVVLNCGNGVLYAANKAISKAKGIDHE